MSADKKILPFEPDFRLSLNQGYCMETQDFVARVEVEINAPVNDVWNALITPDIIEKYMFGAKTASEWRQGSTITWEGDWHGKPYKDKGIIVELVENRLLSYTHFSPLGGAKDAPENYHLVRIKLTDQGDTTLVRLTQKNNSDEQSKEHSEKNWRIMLDSLKKVVEQGGRGRAASEH
jgi:uncharacterized protein YndB with AHSA1/START domain